MTLSTQNLKINRLAIVKSGKRVYDQQFHAGVNIIRGDNGTGKSTIMDFIFYSLGGTLRTWTKESLLCERVYCEAELNGKVLTLQRDISENEQNPMSIYDGPFEKSTKDSVNWAIYPQRRSESKISYSQLLFDYLSLPQHKTEEYANITMHQILRLIYVDQITATNKILREESQYDNRNIRKAVGELLLGLDDLNAHGLRQDLISKSKQLENANGQISAIVKFFKSTDEDIKRENIRKNVQEFESTRENLVSDLKMARKEKDLKLTPKKGVNSDASRIKIIELQKSISAQKLKLNDLNAEIDDTNSFISTLKKRIKALHESEVAFTALGEVTFLFCPVCLTPLDTKDSTVCHLCKTEKKEKGKSVAHLQMKNELEFQIKESSKIMEEKKSNYSALHSQIPSLESQLKQLKDSLEIQLDSTNDLDNVISDLAEKIGYLNKAIETENDKEKYLALLDEYSANKLSLMEEINKINAQLERIRSENENRVEDVKANIESKTLILLKKDLQFEPEFENGENFFFDFAEDRMFLNGRSKYSASSMVILKNSFRFSIFLESVMDRLMRFPRFILIDNIEDKGMQPERSQNFQKIVVDECAVLKKDHQVIFTTSMINPSLDNSSLCVGPFYKKGTHTLEF